VGDGWLIDFYSTPVGEQSIAISLSVCQRAYLSNRFLNRWTNLREIFLCRSPVAMARSSSGGVAIHYVLPVLWMTSRLVVMGRIGIAILGLSLMSMNASFVVYFSEHIMDGNLQVVGVLREIEPRVAVRIRPAPFPG